MPDDSCPICGAELQWEPCDADCNEGFFDAYEDDQINESPETWETCDVCLGMGGYTVCTRLPHTEEQMQAHREKKP